jgi:hypothetical protein
MSEISPTTVLALAGTPTAQYGRQQLMSFRTKLAKKSLEGQKNL